MKPWGKFLFALLILCHSGHAQGFVNLNFENATAPSSGGPFYATVSGWSAYYGGGGPTASLYYNSFSLGGSIVALQDANASNYGAPLPIQGNYSVLLQGSFVSTPTAAAIGQTGTISTTTQSLTFWGNIGGTLQVTFNGQPITYLVTGSTANYNIYAADISAYAGQTGQLLFTAPPNNDALLDNIQFSTTAVPEPSTFALITFGGLLLGFRRWQTVKTRS